MPQPPVFESPTARLSIDLDALAHNFHALSADAAPAEIAPVVKADGYGLGAGPIAKRLWTEGARSFFVARLSEASALRAALDPGRPATIYVLDGLALGAAQRLGEADLTPVISTLPQVRAADEWAKRAGRRWPVAVHVNTGMNRQGLSLDEARVLAAAPGALDIILLLSHLGSAAEPRDTRNTEQLERFQALRPLFPGARASLGASAGARLGPEYSADIVRPGISLYGGGPFGQPDPRLRAVARLTAPILEIHELQAGDRVSYGAAVTLERPARVAVVAAGYADGLLRSARGKGRGWLGERSLPILAVDMDLIVLDLQDAAASVGDEVELLGPRAHLDELAVAAGTVPHEILVRLSGRAERVYLGVS
jgi:alanine racemase